MLHPLVKHIARLQFPNTFNPYSTNCDLYDLPNASSLRASYLSEIIRCAVDRSMDAIWIGRDLGYRGGRRTGLAFTDDIHIKNHFKRWGVPEKMVTVGEPVKERTASTIWGVLDEISENIFLWNAFPLHPHEPDNSFTNRKHNSQEASAGEEILTRLIEIIRPRRLIAVGVDATKTANRVSGKLPVLSVRHPSYGGQKIFIRQVETIYGLRLASC